MNTKINRRGILAGSAAAVLAPGAALLPGQASAQELARFAQLWQARVKAMLIDHVDDPRLVQVSEWQPPA